MYAGAFLSGDFTSQSLETTDQAVTDGSGQAKRGGSNAVALTEQEGSFQETVITRDRQV